MTFSLSTINLLDRSRYWNCTNEEYHASMTEDSHSSLDLFMRSIEQYAGQRVYGDCPRPAPNDAMIFGSLVHTVILEPERIDAEYIIEEKHDRRTKKGKVGWQDFVERADGKKIVTKWDMEKSYAMKEGVDRNETSRIYMASPGISEVAIKYEDPETGIPLKVRMDRLLENGIIFDLKTTDDTSPTAWSKTVYNFGYHRQAAMYLDGAKLFGINGPFVFCAVSKTPPHESVCYRLDDNAISLGRSENELIKRELSERKKSGTWSGRWSGKLNVVGLPRYAYSVGR